MHRLADYYLSHRCLACRTSDRGTEHCNRCASYDRRTDDKESKETSGWAVLDRWCTESLETSSKQLGPTR